MTRVLIVEDEMLAAKRIQRLLGDLDQEYEVLGILDSVKNAAKWLAKNEQPDLLFLDIQLGDGLSFEIFDIVSIDCPVIFITAFDQYAIEAFNHNGIGYLLKPVNMDDLKKALNRFHEMKQKFNTDAQTKNINSARSSIATGFKSRFLIKVGEHIKTVLARDISYICSRDKTTYIQAIDGTSYILDYSLEQVIDLLDPSMFYRISRKYIVAIDAIQDIISYSNSRLELKLSAQENEEVIVSRERVAEFKAWLDR